MSAASRRFFESAAGGEVARAERGASYHAQQANEREKQTALDLLVEDLLAATGTLEHAWWPGGAISMHGGMPRRGNGTARQRKPLKRLQRK